jgi:hypothetical protein
MDTENNRKNLFLMLKPKPDFFFGVSARFGIKLSPLLYLAKRWIHPPIMYSLYHPATGTGLPIAVPNPPEQLQRKRKC